MFKMFSERAALLVSLTIATFLNRMGRQTESVVAVTGTITIFTLIKDSWHMFGIGPYFHPV